MYWARRPMAMPARMFSLVASSTKPRGAMMRTWARAAGSSGRTARTPAKWSMWLWVKITATTGAGSRCWRARASAAAAVSTLVSGSTTIQPVAPRISVMLERS